MIVSLILFVLLLLAWLGGLWTILGEWGVLAWLIGLAAYLFIPLAAGRVGGPNVRIGRHLINSGSRFLGRCLLVCHKHGGYSIIASRFDPKYGLETGIVNGRRGHWEDPNNAMSKLATAQFGIVTDKLGVILDLKMGEFAQQFHELVASGEHERVAQVQVGHGKQKKTQAERQFAKFVQLSKDMVPIDPRSIKYMIPGWADPFHAKTGETYGKNSLELLGQQFSRGQVAAFLISFLFGAGVMYFARRLSGDGAGGNETQSDPLPMMLDVVGYLPGVIV